MEIGELSSICTLAKNEESAIRERLKQVQIKIDELPYLMQRIELSIERDALRQELLSAENKHGNLLSEMEFVKNKTVVQD